MGKSRRHLANSYAHSDGYIMMRRKATLTKANGERGLASSTVTDNHKLGYVTPLWLRHGGGVGVGAFSRRWDFLNCCRGLKWNDKITVRSGFRLYGGLTVDDALEKGGKAIGCNQ